MKIIKALNYEKLGLTKSTLAAIRDIDPKELVVSIYKYTNIPNISHSRWRMISNALVEAGFLPPQPFGKDGDIMFLSQVLGMSQEELYRHYDILERSNPSKRILYFFSEVIWTNPEQLCERCGGFKEFYTARRVQELLDIINLLEPIESTILKEHFGIPINHQPLGYEEIARQLKTTHEQVEAIEMQAIYKLRHPKRRAQLMSWFFDEPTGALNAAIQNRITSLNIQLKSILYEFQQLKDTPVFEKYSDDTVKYLISKGDITI